MSKITYANKEALYENSDIADINKVKAEDMNEIKECVNNNDDMLTGGEVAGNMVVESIRTKNMLNIKSMYGATTGGANTDISTSNNVQITSITNSSVSFTTSANWNGVACDFIEVKPSNEYILSFQSSTATNQMFVKICLYDGSKAFIQDIYATGNLNFTITTTSATKYVKVIIEKIESSSSAIILSNIQLEEGSTATDYSEYQDLNPGSITTYTDANGWIIKKYSNRTFEAFYPFTASNSTTATNSLFGNYSSATLTIPLPDILSNSYNIVYYDLNASFTNAFSFAVTWPQASNLAYRIVSSGQVSTATSYRLSAYVSGKY